MEEYSEEDKIKIAEMRKQLKKAKTNIATGHGIAINGAKNLKRMLDEIEKEIAEESV